MLKCPCYQKINPFPNAPLRYFRIWYTTFIYDPSLDHACSDLPHCKWNISTRCESNKSTDIPILDQYRILFIINFVSGKFSELDLWVNWKATRLQPHIPVFVRLSNTYFCRDRTTPSTPRATSIPRKYRIVVTILNNTTLYVCVSLTLYLDLDCCIINGVLHLNSVVYVSALMVSDSNTMY